MWDFLLRVLSLGIYRGEKAAATAQAKADADRAELDRLNADNQKPVVLPKP